MTTLKKWQFFSKLGSQPPLKSAYPGSCPPKKLFLGRFFLENHFFDPFRPNEDPQVLYMAGKLWSGSPLSDGIKNKYFFSSCRAYDFLGRSAQIFSFILRSCHNHYHHYEHERNLECECLSLRSPPPPTLSKSCHINVNFIFISITMIIVVVVVVVVVFVSYHSYHHNHDHDHPHNCCKK